MMIGSFKILNFVRYAVLGIGVLGGFAALPACAAGSDGEGDGTSEKEQVATTAQAVTNDWTGWTTDGKPPVTCDTNNLVSAFWCHGSNCDDMRMYCSATPGTRGQSYWTGYISEESNPPSRLNYVYCDGGSWITGLSCRGSKCDDVSVQCTYMNLPQHDCFWTGWHSEEFGGILDFGGQGYAAGVQCNGGNCDNLRYYVCKI